MGTTFYAYSVLTRQTTWQSTFRYIIIMAGAVVIVAYLIYFLRRRIVKSSVTFYRRKLQTVSSRLRPYGVDYLNP